MRGFFVCVNIKKIWERHLLGSGNLQDFSKEKRMGFICTQKEQD